MVTTRNGGSAAPNGSAHANGHAHTQQKGRHRAQEFEVSSRRRRPCCFGSMRRRTWLRLPGTGLASESAAALPAALQFFGPHLGPLGIMLGLPAVCYALVYACNASGCMHLAPKFSIPGFPPGQRLFSWQALGVYVAWLVAQVLLHLLLPGQRRQGVVLADGSRLTYKLNGGCCCAVCVGSAQLPWRRRRWWWWCAGADPLPPLPACPPPSPGPAGLRSMVITLGAVLYFGFWRRSWDLGWVYDNYLPLVTASVICSAALSLALYAASFARGRLLAQGGTTGYPLYDCFIGRELNPRIGGFDLKEFCELYPGGCGWVVLVAWCWGGCGAWGGRGVARAALAPPVACRGALLHLRHARLPSPSPPDPLHTPTLPPTPHPPQA